MDVPLQKLKGITHQLAIADVNLSVMATSSSVVQKKEEANSCLRIYSWRLESLPTTTR